MNVFHVIFIIWALLLTAFTALMVYRGHLNNHETDQLFLSDNANEILVEEHNDVVRRATFIQPFCNGLGSAAALVSVLLVGVYVAKNIHNIRF